MIYHQLQLRLILKLLIKISIHNVINLTNVQELYFCIATTTYNMNFIQIYEIEILTKVGNKLLYKHA